MKKKENHENKGAKNSANKSKTSNPDKSEAVDVNEEEINEGFGAWLKSSDGLEMIRLFVIANSLLLFVTMGWPSMQEAFNIVKEFFTGEDEEY